MISDFFTPIDNLTAYFTNQLGATTLIQPHHPFFKGGSTISFPSNLRMKYFSFIQGLLSCAHGSKPFKLFEILVPSPLFLLTLSPQLMNILKPSLISKGNFFLTQPNLPQLWTSPAMFLCLLSPKWPSLKSLPSTGTQEIFMERLCFLSFSGFFLNKGSHAAQVVLKPTT